MDTIIENRYFSNVIGYEHIKRELDKVIDMMKNPKKYSDLGARFPSGIMFIGKPGMGKTLMATECIKAIGRPTYVIRRDCDENELAEKINNSFVEAGKNAPSVILLDDLDKFSNDDYEHSSSTPFIAVQSGIDSVADKQVLVLATANDIEYLPKSLCRAGRIDKIMKFEIPDENDKMSILAHYMETKCVSDDINMTDLVKLNAGWSCAELETILNDAAMSAAYEGSDEICMRHIVEAVLSRVYGSCVITNAYRNENEMRRVATHEAGHILVAEIIKSGCVGLASINLSKINNIGGFTHICTEVDSFDSLLIGLGGKVATELNFSGCDKGGVCDVAKVNRELRIQIEKAGTHGYGLAYPFESWTEEQSQNHIYAIEVVVAAEMERLEEQVRSILIDNSDTLKKITQSLLKKKTLLYSDIRELMDVKNESKI